MTSVTLDRGEIVTIGMYRDFDLSVPQAALGSIQNSSMWAQLGSETKSEIIKLLFQFLDSGSINKDEFLARLQAICAEAGQDYTRLLDGDADGDGKVTILDVTCIQKKLASMEVPSFNEKAADADEDGKITVLDATYIQMWLASVPSNDHIGQPIA